MRIGILGSGLMGGKLGTILARAGHEVVFSYSRRTEKLKMLAADAGANARVGTPHEAAQGAVALLLAVHWSRINNVLEQVGDFAGKVIVTCSLPMNVICSPDPGPKGMRDFYVRIGIREGAKNEKESILGRSDLQADPPPCHKHVTNYA